MMIYKTRTAVSGLADILFPPRCVLCGSMERPGQFALCSGCLSLIKFIGVPLCTSCGAPFAGAYDTNHLCEDCISLRPPFTVARALGMYEKTLLDAIHLFKYNSNIGIGEKLGEMMARYNYDSLYIGDYSLIIPVPLHPVRLRKRGFNQALILARHIAKRFLLPLDFTVLRRSVDTQPQVGLGKSERRRNIKGAFTVTDTERVRDQNVLLVDDVYTTGSTVRECTRALLGGSAKEVAVLTLARA